MKKLLLSIISLLLFSCAVFADEKQEALDFFNSYVKYANSYNDIITTMYKDIIFIILK